MFNLVPKPAPEDTETETKLDVSSLTMVISTFFIARPKTCPQDLHTYGGIDKSVQKGGSIRKNMNVLRTEY